ncbi:Dormancy/auxin associated protein [Dillenia turbinata]|uniref:Dormancy/auxin associated protein n=1 Tax=Dillenia turbinata TaxID=194707 RepID=A0AAN8YVT5_9MAGN
MGFLHKLWDETLAGPAPETGLAKLRKYDSFPLRHRPSPVSIPATPDDDHLVSRTITILRSPNSSFRNRSATAAAPDSNPSSPATSTTPVSPFSPGTPRGDFKRFPRKKTVATADAFEHAEHSDAKVYDWIVMSALDR